jgi:glycosyltransferase involved in cell wall biosynthesis
MRIALLAPFEEPVPPPKYGGTERVVYSLAEELVKLGHDVTLLASGDSHTSARLIPCVETSLRPFIEKNQRTWYYMEWQGFHRALQHLRAEPYDILHNHGGWPFLIAGTFTNAPMLTTIHNPVQFKLGIQAIYRQYSYVSISDAERKYLPKLKYEATVHHGIDIDTFEYNDKPHDYLAFLGRMSPAKGPKEAIEIAKLTGNKLVMAAKIDPPDRPYFRKVIKPLIDGKQIVFIGEVAQTAKVALLKNARALLSPIQWDEPFGLTNVEAMACGTPVIATDRGAHAEVIVEGKTGYLCKTVKQMAARVADIDKIKRAACREHVEQHFSSACMARNYVKVYEKVASSFKPPEVVKRLKIKKPIIPPAAGNIGEQA